MSNQGKVFKTTEEWKRLLEPETYRVTREKGTERPFSGKYLNEERDGMYNCANCGVILFSSDAKFDSGTGWPSFDQVLPNTVEFREDSSLGMTRTEVTCAKCGAHLGHVFDDGPKETTGKRYCINSCALDLKLHDSDE